MPDLVQETFLRAWRRLASLRDPDAFRPWLLQIARRTATDFGRTVARRPRSKGLSDQPEDSIEFVDPNARPEDRLAFVELADRIGAAIHSLSQRDAALITAAIERPSSTELARVFGLTPTAAKVALHRARIRLHAELGKTA